MHRTLLRASLIAGLAFLATACGRKPTEFETSFVDGCASSAGNASRTKCQCTYDEVHKHYGNTRMTEISQGKVPADFNEVLGSAMVKCVSK